MSDSESLVLDIPEPYTGPIDINTTCDEEDHLLLEELDFVPLHPVTTTTSHELYYLLTNSVPLFFTFFFQYSIQILIPTYFSSRIGPLEMSSCTLSITTWYLTGPVMVNGFTSALDTLCSTAFGAQHYHRVGQYYVKCTIVLLILLIPSMYFWSHAGSFFQRITSFKGSQNQELAALCASFISVFTYVAPAIGIFECTKRFLQSQCKFSVPTRIVIGGIPISILFNMTIPKFLDSNSLHKAPAISFVFTYWIMTIALVSYMFFVDGYQCLPTIEGIKAWTVKSFVKSSFVFFQLGVPGVIMILSEAFAFQIITFLSTSFPKSQLAAQSIISTLASLAFQPPFAVGICCSTRIANIIGAKSENYKPAMKAIYILMIGLSIFNFSWFFFLRNRITSLFTSDPEILDIAQRLAIIIAINQFLDCFNILCAAVLRGQGRQRIGSFLSLTTYYLIGIPLELFFAFKLDWKIYGLWIGLAIGVNFLSLLEMVIVNHSNWNNIIKESRKRS
ncbi:hypothetical protein JL09_g2531 [Pichia kudriavzevii]|uniref:Ethionine resistance-conferring protein 1 n=1 Tax=Pichia kudriavzevii TaxID=4909 RepID=A0A099P2T1_PICKU|nr:hypothetical protein JL09_g2531 [Pichia kudriavzevii]